MSIPASINHQLLNTRVPLPDDYIAFWNPSLITGATLPDATGNHDAILNGNAQKDGDFLLLDGNGDYAVAADSSDWDTSTATWYAEVKFSTQSVDSVILSRDESRTGSRNRQFWLGAMTTGEIRMIIWNSSETSQSELSPATYDDDILHKIAVTVDGSRIKIIIDGSKVVDEPQTVTMSSYENIRFAMGRRDTSEENPRYYDGRLGEMGFWNYAIDEDILNGATR